MRATPDGLESLWPDVELGHTDKLVGAAIAPLDFGEVLITASEDQTI